MTIIDGKNAILGRLASDTAKKLLSGETVEIINAKDVIITGNPNATVKKYMAKKQIGSPQHGPFWPRQSDRIVSRTIRSMLPKEKRGRAAFKRLRVHADAAGKTGEPVAVKTIKSNYMTVGEVAKLLGGKK